MRLPPLPTIKDILAIYRLHAIKRLSQNFLMDRNLTRKIVRAAGPMKDGYVCEVGPGPGGITRAILEQNVKQLCVVEKDARFMPSLEMLSEASDGRMRIYQADILRFDLTNIFPLEAKQDWFSDPPNIHIIGNLPFNVSTPLIIKWLEQISRKTAAWSYGRTGMTLTFQKEVAERMVAPMLHQQRTRLSVMCQSLCWVRHVFTIPGKAFVPKPDVDVAVVTFEPLKQKRIDLPFTLVEKVVRHVFHHRQKRCFYGISTLFPHEERKELTDRMLKISGTSPETKPFQLHNSEFNSLCHAYNEICQERKDVFSYDYRSRMAVLQEKQYRKIRREMMSQVYGQTDDEGQQLNEDETDQLELMELLQDEYKIN